MTFIFDLWVQVFPENFKGDSMSYRVLASTGSFVLRAGGQLADMWHGRLMLCVTENEVNVRVLPAGSLGISCVSWSQLAVPLSMVRGCR